MAAAIQLLLPGTSAYLTMSSSPQIANRRSGLTWT